MKYAYAITDPARSNILLYQTDDFDSNRVTETAVLSDGLLLLLCPLDHEAEEKNRLLLRLQEAEEANASKEAFLSNMSHDIRTPMNAIIGMTVLAKKHIDEKNRVIDALTKIETASGHLLNLVNDVLEMSHINSGRLQIHEAVFSIGNLLHDLLVMTRPLVEAKKHTLELDIDGITEEDLCGDILRLRQIYLNILSNAIKYTPDGGSITLSVSTKLSTDQCVLEFVCRDNGIGMTPDFLEHIYDPFERVQTSTMSGIEGTGLGMSIVKKLIDAMHGTIHILSTPGAGTTVTISIPLKIDTKQSSRPLLPSLSLLIVESDKPSQERFLHCLKDTSVYTRIAGTVSEALTLITDARYRNQPFDMILLGKEITDSQDVLEFADYLHHSMPDMPLILVSDVNWNNIEYRAQKCGIVTFIPVPFFRNSLLNGIAGTLSTSDGQAPGTSYPDLQGCTLLLVEDNLINREIASEILALTQAKIDTAENGQEAVQHFLEAPSGTYSLILMDIQMPVMDGYTATEQIRASAHADAKTIPIFAMTANTFAEDISKAHQCGMNGHIAKPVDIENLMRILRTVPGRR